MPLASLQAACVVTVWVCATCCPSLTPCSSGGDTVAKAWARPCCRTSVRHSRRTRRWGSVGQFLLLCTKVKAPVSGASGTEMNNLCILVILGRELPCSPQHCDVHVALLFLLRNLSLLQHKQDFVLDHKGRAFPSLRNNWIKK